MFCQACKSHEKSAKYVRITTALRNQPIVMTYFNIKENHTLTEHLPVSSEKLYVSSLDSVTTALSSNAKPVIPFSQFAVMTLLNLKYCGLYIWAKVFKNGLSKICGR